uniref:Homeobox protein ceh-18 n=1 Tax=Ascaris suum TaxID=6253 RepID=F1L570_ASCSU
MSVDLIGFVGGRDPPSIIPRRTMKNLSPDNSAEFSSAVNFCAGNNFGKISARTDADAVCEKPLVSEEKRHSGRQTFPSKRILHDEDVLAPYTSTSGADGAISLHTEQTRNRVSELAILPIEGERTAEHNNSHRRSSIAQGDKALLKRRILHADKETIQKVALTTTRDDRMELEDLADFAESFVRQRTKFGVTQANVASAVGLLNGINFCQTTVSRFETMNLSLSNMRKLRPLLEEWLIYAETMTANGCSTRDLPRVLSRSAFKQGAEMDSDSRSHKITQADHSASAAGQFVSASGPCLRKRRSRTNYNVLQRETLEAFFKQTPYPDKETLTNIAAAVNLHPYIVKTWFCNRRQKVHKEERCGS